MAKQTTQLPVNGHRKLSDLIEAGIKLSEHQARSEYLRFEDFDAYDQEPSQVSTCALGAAYLGALGRIPHAGEDGWYGRSFDEELISKAVGYNIDERYIRKGAEFAEIRGHYYHDGRGTMSVYHWVEDLNFSVSREKIVEMLRARGL